jgi:hypothetical protein
MAVSVSHEKRPWLALLAIGVLLVLAHAHHRLNADEGTLLLSAWSIRLGRTPYIDDFQFIAPGAAYLLAGAWALTGPQYLVAKLLGIGAIALTCVAIARLSRLLAGADAPARTIWLGAVLYAMLSTAWPAINHNTFNAACIAWSLVLLVEAVTTPSRAYLAGAGLLAGCAALMVQHKGGVFIVAGAASVLITYGDAGARGAARRALLFALAAGLPLVVLLRWPPAVLVDQLLRFPAQHYLGVNQSTYWPLLTTLAYFAVTMRALRRRWTPMHTVLAVTQVSLLVTALQRTDIAHVAIIAFPLLAMLPAALHACGELTRTALVLAPVALGLLATLGAQRPFGDITTRWPMLATIRTLCPTLHAGPFLPGLYYELRVPNPTRYPFLLSGFNTDEQFAEAHAALDRDPPSCIVMAYGRVRHFNYRANTPIEALIRERYVLHTADQDVQLFTRRR